MICLYMHVLLWPDTFFHSVTSHQMNSTESLACPCPPLIVSLSGKRMNWRNRFDSSEGKPTDPLDQHQQCAPKVASIKLLLTHQVAEPLRCQKKTISLLVGCTWCSLGLLKQYMHSHPAGDNWTGEGRLEVEHRAVLEASHTFTTNMMLTLRSWLRLLLLPAGGTVVLS